ncbi:MAG: hypothetical protein ACFE8N_07345 [Promethearchaeota archaeon]
MSVIPEKIGFALSLIGGIISFAFGSLLPIIFSEIHVLGSRFVTTLQMIIIIGGIVTIEGAILFWIKPSISGKLIIVGAVMAGINPISLYGGIRIIKLNSGS